MSWVLQRLTPLNDLPHNYLFTKEPFLLPSLLSNLALFLIDHQAYERREFKDQTVFQEIDSNSLLGQSRT